jgi:hypothetical protein
MEGAEKPLPSADIRDPVAGLDQTSQDPVGILEQAAHGIVESRYEPPRAYIPGCQEVIHLLQLRFKSDD